MENNLVSLCLLILPSFTPLTHPIQPTLTHTVPARLTTWPKSLGPLASWLSVGQDLLTRYHRGEKFSASSPALALLRPLVWLRHVPP